MHQNPVHSVRLRPESGAALLPSRSQAVASSCTCRDRGNCGIRKSRRRSRAGASATSYGNCRCNCASSETRTIPTGSQAPYLGRSRRLRRDRRFDTSAVGRRGAEDGDGHLGVEAEPDTAERVGLLHHPCLVRIQRKNRCPTEGTAPRGDRNLALDAGHRRPRGRHVQQELGAAEQLEAGLASRQRPGLVVDDWNALATLLRTPMRRWVAAPSRPFTRPGAQPFVAGGGR